MAEKGAGESGKNNKEYIIGIDDAGRGPVIGPMVLAGVLIYKEIEEELRRAGIKDSKLLTAKKREELFAIVKQMSIASHHEILTPAEIDTGMGKGLNLNEVEAMASAMIINNLAEKLTEEEREKQLVVVIDCPSTNPNAWINTLMKYVKKEFKKIRIKAEHKADFHYPGVSAASIIAKVTRDSEIKRLKKEIGFDFGSGYPADEKTTEALKKHKDKLKKARLIRESWATWQNMEKKEENKKRGKQTNLPDY